MNPAVQTQEKLEGLEETKKNQQENKSKVCKCKVPNRSDRREISTIIKEFESLSSYKISICERKCFLLQDLGS